MTTPLSGLGSPAPTQATQSPSAAAFDKDTFMKLLVAQLKYQNPMSPTDSNEYMSQMAVFAQVEKLGALLTSQQASEAWQQRISAQTMVGRQVTGTDADDSPHTGTVTAVDVSGKSPLLTLSDGSTLALTDVTTVEGAPAPQ